VYHKTNEIIIAYIHTVFVLLLASNTSSVLQLPFKFPCLLWFFGYIAISSILTWSMYRYRWQSYLFI